jgi:GTP-binding protein HflX
LIDLRTPVERAVLVASPRKGSDPAEAREHLEELARLTDTAGGEVVGVVQQFIEAPHPRFYIGEGKVEELRDLIVEQKADLVIFDEELSPAQGKNLETFLDTRVMDRPELILDIFATRARTREAKMQVELAQLQYLLPRITRMWNHLSRQRGGIGLRGPGETQLETDRRLIGTRISSLLAKLKEVAQARAVRREGRKGQFRVALVGYTNAGKSSLLRALSGSDVFVEDRLFATLDSATRSVDLGDGFEALVTDTVGFIRKLPHHLIASFRSTLEEAREADLLLHVMDVSHPDLEEHRQVVQEVLEELELDDRPQVLVFNKVDRITHDEERVLRERAHRLETSPAVFVSALEPDSLEELKDTLRVRVRATMQTVTLRIPARDGESLATAYREGEVLDARNEGGDMIVDVRLPGPALGRLLQRAGVSQEPAGSAVESSPGGGA